MKKEGQITTFLGKDAALDGKLKFHGTIEIAGHFKGEISSKGSLIVGEGGMVEASVHTASVFTSGEIHGDIIAEQMVKIHTTGKIFGSIKAPAMVIDEGGIFEGHRLIHQANETDLKLSAVTGPDMHYSDPSPSLGTIHGVVTGEPHQAHGTINDVFADMERGEKAVPIKYAKITATCRGVVKKTTRTDASGYYKFTDLEDGEWKLKFKAKGYEKEESMVKISGGGEYEENFE